MALPQPLREPDPAGHRLVQVDRRLFRVRRADLGHETEVARVDHQQDRCDRLDRPARRRAARRRARRDASGRARASAVSQYAVVWSSSSGRSIGPQPTFSSVTNLSFLNRVTRLATITSPCLRRPAGGRRLGEHLERLERDRPVGVGVVVDVDLVDVGLALVPLEPVHVVLDRLVDVDRALVDEHLGAEQVDLAEDARSVGRRVDDHDVLRGRGPQRDLRCREVLARPVPAPVAGLSDVAFLGQERQQVVGRRRPEHLARLERQLERRRPQMREQDVQVVRVEPGLLRRVVEQELRVVDDVLVDRRARGDEHRDAGALPPAGPTELLPRGGDRSRIAGEDRHVQSADVDAELERVRRRPRRGSRRRAGRARSTRRSVGR